MIERIRSEIRMDRSISCNWMKCIIYFCFLGSIHKASSFPVLDQAPRINKLKCTKKVSHQLKSFSSSRQSSLSYTSTPRTILSSSRNNKSFIGAGITSELISQLAIIALKLRLEAQSDVQCKVNGRTRDLMMQGKVGPVTVKGRGWESPLGLTCRAIEATVQECSLDVGKIVQLRKLNLIVPAKGDAMIALSSTDFGNFITHPLLEPPNYESSDGKLCPIAFNKDGVSIDIDKGVVLFTGTCMGHQFNLSLTRGDENGGKKRHRKAQVIASLKNNDDESSIEESTKLEMESNLSQIISQYFTELVFDLDGTFLSFRDMMVTDKGKSPSVMLALSILVRKFPSPGVAF